MPPPRLYIDSGPPPSFYRVKAPLGGIFHNRPVNTAGRVKNQYRCAWLVYPSLVIILLSAKPQFLVYLSPMFYWLPPCRIHHEQLCKELFQTVKPGAAMRDPLPGAGSKQLRYQRFIFLDPYTNC